MARIEVSMFNAYGPETPEQREKRLQRDVEYYKGELRRVQEQPCAIRTVIAMHGQRAVVSTPLAPVEVRLPERLEKPVVPGSSIRVRADNGAFIEVCDEFMPSGPLHPVVRVLGPGWCEVTVQADSRAVATSFDVSVGDRVQLDPTGSVVVANRGKPGGGFEAPEDTLDWDDIIGAEDAKRELREAIEWPVKHRDVFERFGRKPVRGVLLSGPPGNGKTLLARAAANALRRLHGASGASGFIWIKGPEILNKFVGASEGNIRDIFARARKHRAEHGYPALIFVDEADSVFSKRGQGRSSDMERTIVPQFLAEMDGMEDAGAMLILATNRPEVLDPAAVRPGRIDRVIHVARPSREAVAKIVEKGFQGKPMGLISYGSGDEAEVTPEKLALTAVDWLFDERCIVRTVQTTAGPVDVPLSLLVSGAISASVVERAVSRALERAVHGSAAGVTHDDVAVAVKSIATEHRHIDLGDDVTEWILQQARQRATQTPPEMPRPGRGKVIG